MITRLAAELAGAASAADARAVVARWHPPGRGAPVRPPSPPGEGVGIWQRRVVAGATVLVRQTDDGQPLMWAQTERIGPKDARKRVVLLGESAARGWPLDPLFTCASSLSAQLRQLGLDDGIEIVDLASCGLDAPALVQLGREAAMLEPDAYVVFAGNNWSVDLSTLGWKAIAADLRATASWRSVAAHLERGYRGQIDAVLAALDAVLRPQNVPVLFVIPACNLRDWQPTPHGHHPLLTAADRRRADQLAVDGRTSLTAGDVDAAHRAASELCALEDGFSAAGLDLAARCALARNDASQAVRSFEAAGDVGLLTLVPPFTAASIRVDQLRRHAHGMADAVLDLPRRLLERADGMPPGREFFYDHVHMTPRGIRAATSAIVEHLTALLDLPPAFAADVECVPRTVEPRALAQAHFAAAIKSARADQPGSFVRYHCAAAHHATPAILPVVRDYVTRSLIRTPDVFCSAYHRLRALEPQFPVLRHFLVLPPHRPKPPHLELALAFIDTLRGLLPEAAAGCEALLYDQHASTGRPIDLTQEPGTELPGGSLERARFGIVGPAYVACYEQSLSFQFVCPDRPRALALELTCRVPRGRAGDAIRLLVNGARGPAWTATTGWSSVRCDLDPAWLVGGLNTLTVVWPDPREARDERLARVATSFEGQGSARIEAAPGGHIVFADIDRLVLYADARHDSRPMARPESVGTAVTVESEAAALDVSVPQP